MKKNIYLLSVIFFLMLQACSDSNSTNDTINEPPTFTVGPNLTDIDGNIYQSITNCSQTFMQSNLNVSRYRNGDIIPQVENRNEWDNLTTGAWCYYNNDPANGAIYGKLYNVFAVNDPRGLAPVGWHIPSFNEWTTLITCLGGVDVAGDKMRETGTSHWSYNNGATNSSGFTALPGGFRTTLRPTDANITVAGQFWSSSSADNSNNVITLLAVNPEISITIGGQLSGFSIRCIKD